MDKPAITDFPIHELLSTRWSPVAFSTQPVELATLGSLFEAARWTASCFNEQPWSFVVARAQEPDEFAKVLDCIVPANREWAGRAPVLGIAVAHLTFVRNGKPNRHAAYDTGAAMAQLTVQATAMGLRVHQMGGFDPDRARETFAIPEEWDPMAAFALGQPGDSSSLPDALRQRDEAPRVRKPLGEMLFRGGWDSPFHTVPHTAGG